MSIRKTTAALLLSCGLLCSSCVPSDPAGGFASFKDATDNAFVVLPQCPGMDNPLISLTVTEVVDGDLRRQLWKITGQQTTLGNTFQLGVVPDGYKQSGVWSNSFLTKSLFLEANLSGGYQLSNTARYGEYQADTLYIEDEPVDDQMLSDQIYCGGG